MTRWRDSRNRKKSTKILATRDQIDYNSLEVNYLQLILLSGAQRVESP